MREIIPVPIPLDCRDSFNEAYYGRLEMLLEDGARLSCPAWSFVTSELAATYVEKLKADLASGKWTKNMRHSAARRNSSARSI